MSVRTRFAPSPTGSLHVGGARTALYSRLFAHQHGGQFLLRIEDTDQARSTEEATHGILADMHWLGLTWEEGPEIGGPCGPYLQSQRLEIYDRYVQQLLDEGKAYEAWESKEELEALRRVATAEQKNFRFRLERPYSPTELATFREEGRKPVVRLRAPEVPVTVQDVVLGEMTQQPDEIEDVVIRKADGFPTYHFAVVVDDHLMEISHVLRGSEHYMNTTKHLVIRQALGWDDPVYGHLPIIFNPNGSKMSKRDKARTAREAARAEATAIGAAKGDFAWLSERCGVAADELRAFMDKKNDSIDTANAIAAALQVELPMIEVMDFRKAGFLPEALLNYLALLGWSAGDDREHYTEPELTAAFTLERVNRQPARFDVAKLLSMNADRMREVSDERYAEALQSWLEVVDSPLGRLDEARLASVVALFRSRARTFVDLEQQSRFLRAAPTAYDEKHAQKHLLKGGGLDHLRDARVALADVGRWESDAIERGFTKLCESSGTALGKYAQPVRIAIAGNAVTPPLFETLAALSRDDALARMDRTLEHFEGRS